METTSIECVGISGYPRSKIIRKQIGLRVACAVGCLTILICAAVTLQGLSEAEHLETKYNSVAEFLITVGLVGMIAESVLTVIHYLPITIINQHFTLFGFGFVCFTTTVKFGSLAYNMISTIKQKRQENSESSKEVNNMQNPVMQ